MDTIGAEVAADRIMDGDSKRISPGHHSYKKLSIIGRMFLFKNNKTVVEEWKKRNLQPRRTRFDSGNLPKSIIPKPDQV